MRARDRIASIAQARGWVLADRWRARLAGWIGRRTLAAGEGLCLLPCNAIHTFGMRVPIDAVFIDRTLRVVRCVTDLPPRRLALAWRAVAVIEMPAGGAARAGLRPGVRLASGRPDTGAAAPAPVPISDIST